MRRPHATAPRTARLQAAAWFLLTLTAVCALLGPGLDAGRASDQPTRVLVVRDVRGGDAPAVRTNRRSDARLPVAGASLSGSPSAAGPHAEFVIAGGVPLISPQVGTMGREQHGPAWVGSTVEGQHGRAPPA